MTTTPVLSARHVRSVADIPPGASRTSRRSPSGWRCRPVRRAEGDILSAEVGSPCGDHRHPSGEDPDRDAPSGAVAGRGGHTAPSGCGDPAPQNRLRVPVPAWTGSRRNGMLAARATLGARRSRSSHIRPAIRSSVQPALSRSSTHSRGRPCRTNSSSTAPADPHPTMRRYREASHDLREFVVLERIAPSLCKIVLRRRPPAFDLATALDARLGVDRARSRPAPSDKPWSENESRSWK